MCVWCVVFLLWLGALYTIGQRARGERASAEPAPCLPVVCVCVDATSSRAVAARRVALVGAQGAVCRPLLGLCRCFQDMLCACGGQRGRGEQGRQQAGMSSSSGRQPNTRGPLPLLPGSVAALLHNGACCCPLCWVWRVSGAVGCHMLPCAPAADSLPPSHHLLAFAHQNSACARLWSRRRAPWTHLGCRNTMDGGRWRWTRLCTSPSWLARGVLSLPENTLKEVRWRGA
jgi:hypothetical protein